jgi:hypothetical protein
VVCPFDQVPVNTYTVSVVVDGGYYQAAAEDVLVVYDPSSKYTEGGGWFYWPGSDQRTTFGFTMEYNKKGTNVRGSLLLIRHVDGEGEIYRIKSNALYGLAIGEDRTIPMGWASFSGKATYLAPGADTEGNHEFIAYVEDRNNPGSGADRFWIEVRDKHGAVIAVISMDPQAADNTEEIEDGAIVVPHKP